MFPRFSVYMTDAGFTLSAATLGVSIYFIANTLSRLFLGALCDKISYKHVYGICGVLCILSAICLIAAHSLFMFYPAMRCSASASAPPTASTPSRSTSPTARSTPAASTAWPCSAT
ncbi:MAG: MFS transporter [Oscillospiraceae bacterium]